MALRRVRGAIFAFRAPKRQVAAQEGAGVCCRQGQTGPAQMHRTSWHRPMGSLRILGLIIYAFLMSWTGEPVSPQSTGGTAPTKEPSSSTEKQANTKADQAGVPGVPRRQKTGLQDGSAQRVTD